MAKGFVKNTFPAGAAPCPYCQGSGCDKCNHKGYYVPDIEHPKYPTPARG